MTDQPQPLNVKVTTRNLDDLDAAPLVHFINYGNHKSQTWLRNHTWWAIHNNHTVHIERVT